MKKSTSDILIGLFLLLIYFFQLNIPPYGFNFLYLFFVGIGIVQILSGIFNIYWVPQKKRVSNINSHFSGDNINIKLHSSLFNHYKDSLLIYIILGISAELVTYSLPSRLLDI